MPLPREAPCLPTSRRFTRSCGRSPSSANQVTSYLSVCSMYRDHAEYLREWIEFHRLVGVDRFFLYNNESSDDHRGVLAPYIAQSVVIAHDWPTPATVNRGVP